MGRACARSLAAQADVLLLTDRDEAGLGEAAASIGRELRVECFAGELAQPGFPAALARRTAELGELGALVHTAGVSPSMADWREVLRVDLVATARLLEDFLPRVRAGSAAVCIASISGHMGHFEPEVDKVLDEPLARDFEARFREACGGTPEPGPTYRLAKRGVIRLCERAAVAWGARGGRVLSLSPGLIDTPMGRLELAEQPVKVELAARTPKRSAHHDGDAPLPGHVRDIAEAVAFLSSPAAGFVSGCDLRVDGGLVGALNHPDPGAPTPAPAKEDPHE